MEFCRKKIDLYHALFKGDIELLSKAYKDNNLRNTWYYKICENQESIIPLHTGLPATITNTIKSLIVSGGVEYELGLAESQEQEAQDLLIDNAFDNTISNVVENCSIYGWTIAKIVKYDQKDIAIKVLSPRYVKDIAFAKGKMTFVSVIIEKVKTENDAEEYMLCEEYTKINNSWVLMYVVYNKKGEMVDRDNVKGMFGIEEYDDFAFDKGFNPVHFFANDKKDKDQELTPFGTSDYAGNERNFDSIDRVNSQWQQEVVNGKGISFIDEQYLPKDANGRTLPMSELTMQYVKSNESQDPNNKNEPIVNVQLDIRSDEYAKTLDILENSVLMNCQLSPLSIGKGASIGANASAAARQIEERVSLRSRDVKIKLLRKSLIDLLSDTMIALDIKVDRTKVDVIFKEYITPSLEENVATIIKLHEAGLMTTAEAVKQIGIASDIEDEIQKLVVRENLDNEIMKTFSNPTIESSNKKEVTIGSTLPNPFQQ